MPGVGKRGMAFLNIISMVGPPPDGPNVCLSPLDGLYVCLFGSCETLPASCVQSGISRTDRKTWQVPGGAGASGGAFSCCPPGPGRAVMGGLEVMAPGAPFSAYSPEQLWTPKSSYIPHFPQSARAEAWPAQAGPCITLCPARRPSLSRWGPSAIPPRPQALLTQ